MAEYSRLAKGNFTTGSSTLGNILVTLPFQPDTVKLWNFTGSTSGGATGYVTEAYWDVSMGQGAAIYNVVTASTLALTAATTTTGGISSFSAGQLLQYGTTQQVIASTKATASFNVSAHGYSVGDVVIFEGLYQSSTTGMPQLSGIPLVITTVTDANNFIVNWNTNQSNYTSLSGSPTGATVKKVLYPFLYEPGMSIIEAITTGTTTTITTSAPHCLEAGAQVAFHVPAAWGTTQLNSTPNSNGLIPGSPIYGYVTSVTSNTVFVCNINSTGYTAYTSNITVAQVKAGISFPQVIAVGDINSGGRTYNGTNNLYPSPVFPTFSGGSSTINGPAIKGAFVNNTFQGFSVGTTVANTVSQTYYFEATLHDYALN